MKINVYECFSTTSQRLHSTGAELMPDYFVDGAEDFFMQAEGAFKKAAKGEKTSGSSSAGGVDALFEQIGGLLGEEMTGTVGAVYRFELKGDEPGNWVVDIKNGPGIVYGF